MPKRRLGSRLEGQRLAMQISYDDLLQHRAFIRASAYDLVHNSHDADDLAQHTLLYAIENPPRAKAAMRTWLRIVVRHLAINSRVSGRRRREREQRVARPELQVDSDPYEDRESRAAVRRMVSKLPDPYRRVITLYYLDGIESKRIAKLHDVPVATVKSQLRRGRGRLLEQLQASPLFEASSHGCGPGAA